MAVHAPRSVAQPPFDHMIALMIAVLMFNITHGILGLYDAISAHNDVIGHTIHCNDWMCTAHVTAANFNDNDHCGRAHSD